jgi:hypothetical protein
MNDHKEEEGIYKGLFFGILLGIGLVYLLNSKTGKEMIQSAKEKIDEVLSEEPTESGYEEVADENTTDAPDTIENPEVQKEKPSSEEPPPRFFNKKEE